MARLKRTRLPNSRPTRASGRTTLVNKTRSARTLKKSSPKNEIFFAHRTGSCSHISILLQTEKTKQRLLNKPAEHTREGMGSWDTGTAHGDSPGKWQVRGTIPAAVCHTGVANPGVSQEASAAAVDLPAPPRRAMAADPVAAARCGPAARGRGRFRQQAAM